MLDWLLALILFWVSSAIYFGGLNRDAEGGTGFRQFVGLLLTYVIFLVVWGLVYKTLGPTAKGVLIASAVAALLLPIWVRLGFMLVGVRVRRATAH